MKEGIVMTKTICNVCGKEFNMWDNQEGFGFDYRVGYGSKHDGENLKCDLCCDCFDKLLDEYLIPKCKHSIIVKEYD